MVEESEKQVVSREAPETRNRYQHFLSIPTRWMDNDVYVHVNNVVYYSYFDTVVNGYLISSGVQDTRGEPSHRPCCRDAVQVLQTHSLPRYRACWSACRPARQQ